MGGTASLYYLQTFHLVATERSFTRAARQLALSQPAVSAHIRALERYYRAPLFAVRHRRVYLTAAGEALYEYTARIFNLLREANRAVAATQGLERGRLALGASPTIGVYLLPDVLAQFRAAHPRVEIELTIDTTAAIVGRLLADELYFGLVEAPVSHPDLAVEPFAEDELVLIAPPGHPWAVAGAVAVTALDGAPVLRREPGSGTQAYVDRMLEHAGVTMATAMVIGNTEALKRAVLAGLGVAWVPRITVRRELGAGDLVAVRVEGLDLRRVLSWVTPRGLGHAPAVAAFLALLGTTLARIPDAAPSGTTASPPPARPG